MDERKKSIRELEEKRRETEGTVNGILEKLGENLLTRLDREGEGYFAGEVGEYHRILGEISDSEESIRIIEADILRLKDLEGEISEKEKINSSKNKELSVLYARLGVAVIETDVAAFFKGQADTLIQKIQSLEDRQRELDEGKHVNIFTWIGNNTQGMVLRSMISKSQASLERVYIAAGEKFSSPDIQEMAEDQDNPLIVEILDPVFTIRQELTELGQSLSQMRSERRKIKDALGSEGSDPPRTISPVKKTKDLERHIIHAREQLHGLYVRFGAHFADTVEDESAARETSLQITERALLRDENKVTLEKIRKLREEIAEYDASIEKLRASLLIDEARDGIDRMEKSITAHRQRIAASEDAITGLEKQIEESNRRIQKLMEI
ncbi:hypothetical protein [Treponema primitia]|uniref:hypothetical protein n=1 Tax=Treponema primitia TaxID=88058 RepID=UPI00025558F1|nr:hypothetical protein [Treponema primitia]